MKSSATTRITIRILLLATVIAVDSIGAVANAASPTISWEIENRFRDFTRSSDFQNILAVYNSLKTSSNPKPTALQLERKLEDLTSSGQLNSTWEGDRRNGWASSVLLHTCGKQAEASHRYATCKTANGDNYLNPQQADVIFRADGIDGGNCEWRIDGTSIGTAGCTEQFPAKDVKYNEGHHLEVTADSGARATIDFVMKDAMIVSMGDSFSAGEGNPDKPASLTDESYDFYTRSSILRGHPQAFPVREDLSLVVPGESKFFGELAASWTNAQCHRSLYSHHTRAALQYALEHPHVSVTFLNYSCTGAEVYEGVLNAWWARDDVPSSEYDDAPQIVKALRDLCKDYSPFEKTDWSNGQRGWDKYFNSTAAEIPACAELIPKRIDALLLSIGGNDVGFARMISNAVVNVPSTGPIYAGRSWVYGLWRAASRPQTFAEGLRLAEKRIPQRYDDLATQLKNLLKVAPYRVILSAYPDMMADESGKRCKPGNVGMDVHVIFGMNDRSIPAKGSDFSKRFHAIEQKEGGRQGWRFADQYFVQDGAENSFTLDAYHRGHGICAQGPSSSQEGNAHLPRPKLSAPPPYSWSPFPPSKWSPYSDRNRWFVTPNDAFLATNYHDPQIAIQDVIQPLYAASLSGSFHPNALGHAAIADSTLIELRKVLGSFED